MIISSVLSVNNNRASDDIASCFPRQKSGHHFGWWQRTCLHNDPERTFLQQLREGQSRRRHRDLHPLGSHDGGVVDGDGVADVGEFSLEHSRHRASRVSKTELNRWVVERVVVESRDGGALYLIGSRQNGD